MINLHINVYGNILLHFYIIYLWNLKKKYLHYVKGCIYVYSAKIDSAKFNSAFLYSAEVKLVRNMAVRFSSVRKNKIPA